MEPQMVVKTIKRILHFPHYPQQQKSLAGTYNLGRNNKFIIF